MPMLFVNPCSCGSSTFIEIQSSFLLSSAQSLSVDADSDFVIVLLGIINCPGVFGCSSPALVIRGFSQPGVRNKKSSDKKWLGSLIDFKSLMRTNDWQHEK